MKWIKKGLIYKSDKSKDWNKSHAQVPLVDKLDEDTLRVYFATRDKKNRSYTTFIELNAKNPKEVTFIHDKLVLSPRDLGCFDDSGAMPSYIVNQGQKKYLYYIGWNRGITVPYRNTIGIAVSDDGGIKFEKIFKWPILARNKFDPYFVATPYVLVEENIWKMWYLSSTGWIVIKDKPEPLYLIKYAESKEGINCSKGWDSLMIEYSFVYKHDGKLYMLYNGNGFGESGFGYAILKKD
jgi:hypothetical protein